MKTNKTPNKKADYKYKWRYTKAEENGRVCYDCKAPYKDFAEFVVDDELWKQINPTYRKGKGILCPMCMANRLNYLGLWYETGLFRLNRK